MNKCNYKIAGCRFHAGAGAGAGGYSAEIILLRSTLLFNFPETAFVHVGNEGL